MNKYLVLGGVVVAVLFAVVLVLPNSLTSRAPTMPQDIRCIAEFTDGTYEEEDFAPDGVECPERFLRDINDLSWLPYGAEVKMLDGTTLRR